MIYLNESMFLCPRSVAVDSFLQRMSLLILKHFLLGKSIVHIFTIFPDIHLLSLFLVFVSSTQSTHRSAPLLVMPPALCRHLDCNTFSIFSPFSTCFAALASFPMLNRDFYNVVLFWFANFLSFLVKNCIPFLSQHVIVIILIFFLPYLVIFKTRVIFSRSVIKRVNSGTSIEYRKCSCSVLNKFRNI